MGDWSEFDEAAEGARDYEEEAAIMAAEAPTRDEEKGVELRLDAEDEARWAAEEEQRLRAAAAQEDDEEYEEECQPEFIDGSYEGCGACLPCVERERERQQRAYDAGWVVDA